MPKYRFTRSMLTFCIFAAVMTACGGGGGNGAPGGTAVDPSSAVTWTSDCLTAGTGARAVIAVTLKDTAGDPLTGATVTMVPTAGSIGAVMSSGSLYWAPLSPPAAGTATATVSVTADGVSLTTTPAIIIEEPFAVMEGGLGACPADGNLRVTVVDENGLPLPGARVMVGSAFSSASFRTAFNAGPQTANTGTTGAGGIAEFMDLGSNLDGPLTVTAAASGRQYLTLVDADASDVVMPLAEVYPSPSGRAFGGSVTGFATPNGDPIETALVLPDLSVEQLGTFKGTDLFSETVCWDAGGALGKQPVPGNLYIPSQCALYSGFCLFSLPEKTYTSQPIDDLDHQLTAVETDIPLSAFSAGPVQDLLESTSAQSIGAVAVTLSTPSSLNLSVTRNLNENLTCAVDNAPPEADIHCLSLGDWDSGLDPSLQIGEGRLLLMGQGFADTAGTDSPVSTGAMTTVIDTGDFAGIDYVAAVVASYNSIVKPGIPPGTEYGSSAILERSGTLFSGSGGALYFSDFIPIRTMTRTNRHLYVSALPGAGHPDPDYSIIDVKQAVAETFTTCFPGDSSRTLEYTLWRVYTPAPSDSVTLPTPPADWPRGSLGGDLAGLVDTSATLENDVVIWEWSTIHEGLNPSFDYNNRMVGDLGRYMTHLSFNTQDY